MDPFWQVDDDIQFWARLFLAVFVLFGLLPFFQRSLLRLRDLLLSRRRARSPGLAEAVDKMAAAPANLARLNDLEYLVLGRLAQAGSGGLTPAALARDLHMDPALTDRTVAVLHRLGLVHIVPVLILLRRYRLSRRGWELAVAEGLVLPLSAH